MNTYDQIKAIMKQGEYFVAIKDDFSCQDTEQIVELKVTPSDVKNTPSDVKNTTSDAKNASSDGKTKGNHDVYKLTDLKELENKVILIRDHRSSSSKSNLEIHQIPSKDIDTFLQVRKLL